MKISVLVNKIRNDKNPLYAFDHLKEVGFIQDDKGAGLVTLRERKKSSLPHFRIGSSIRYLRDDLADFIIKNLKDRSIDEEYNFKEFFDLSKVKKVRKKIKDQVVIHAEPIEFRKYEPLVTDDTDKTIQSLWKVIEELNAKLSYYLGRR